MSEYQKAFDELNPKQRQAVKKLDGPLLVIAGPGTGKTQLLSTRVGYILKNTDTPAESILLLTFTEAGAQTMRERLIKLIGKPAYDVQINTYHSFGGEIFRRYPDYFEGTNLSLVEELGSDSLLRDIVAKLPYSSPLKFADSYISELKNFISEAKRALLAPDDIERIAKSNLEFIERLNKQNREVLDGLQVVSKKSVAFFDKLLKWLSANQAQAIGDVLQLSHYCQQQLEAARQDYDETGKTTSLTGWKRRWLAKNEQGLVIMDGQRANQRLLAAAGIYDSYQQQLASRRQYDYDDMILRAIEALQGYPELKYSLAEQYSYIMLDEFQDTNPSQFKLVELLTDHPVHEGRPNVLAVGDDDQAIYAFQGAEHANMATFANHYKDVTIINLTQNYRSPQPLIDLGQYIAGQVQNRLKTSLVVGDSRLTAAGSNSDQSPSIVLKRFSSDAAQYDYVAKEIKRLVTNGMLAAEIAILAPKHRFLIPLLPYLSELKIPIRYEKRENVLDEPLIHQLERMSQLVVALADGNDVAANAIWPEILSYDYWQVAIDRIWQLNWQHKESQQPWTAQLLNDEANSNIADFFLKLASLMPMTTFEQQLDALLGLPGITEELKLPSRSPIYEYYFSKKARTEQAFDFAKLVGDLSVLRTQLRGWHTSGQTVSLKSFIEFIEGHRAANLNILNTSPYHEQADAVSLLTAYGAKGREFKAVFIIAANDEVWGSASRNQGSRLSLPANLSYIRYQGASEDERLRLFFVAATRARSNLYITSYSKDMAGKPYTSLKYLDIEQTADNVLISRAVPEPYNNIEQDDADTISLTAAANYWTDRHLPPYSQKLSQLLRPRLENYNLSATHLNHFLDVVNGGPDSFLIDCILAFPSAPSTTSAFGTAIHNSLRFAGFILANEGTLPTLARIEDIFSAQIDRIQLTDDEQQRLQQRGRAALKVWLKNSGPDLKKTDWFEHDFRGEGSIVGVARLTGKIDRLIINEKDRQVTVIDYKTGQSYQRWQPGVVKLHKFRQQLNFYKLLVENSARFRGYQASRGIIEFVEPDENGNFNRLELEFDQTELDQTGKLINSVWSHIQQLDFPDIQIYQPNLTGIKNFEADLSK